MSTGSTNLSISSDNSEISGSASSSLVHSVFMFRTIPPERIGLSGEYDYQGLSKRVALAFRQRFNSAEIANLKIRQRGSVVVLTGRVLNQSLLNRLVCVALKVEGATDVEILGVRLLETTASSSVPSLLTCRLP
jgi:hypothetical protein